MSSRLSWFSPIGKRRCRGREIASAARQAMRAALAAVVIAVAGTAPATAEERTLRMTPPRLGLVEGDVSFWRPGTDEWETAQVNIPLAAGDALATRDGRFELQIGAHAFARGGEHTRLRMKAQEPDFLHLEVTEGSAVLDLRELAPGQVIQVDAPGAVLTTTRDGYYRIDASADSTRFTARRAGSAFVTPTGAGPLTLATGEALEIAGDGTQLKAGAAAELHAWDEWNYGRADALLAAPRSYSVSPDVYGAHELERHGRWRYVQTYGRVWVPYSVPVGWAPYTYGRWLRDPVWGWAWADYSPWGWAPFHYGRWVYCGYWAWAPGPLLYSPVYAPALVAFYGPSIGLRVGAPFVSWVALGWGEPLIPWWGRPGFYGVPCWNGWGGPRYVNNAFVRDPGSYVPVQRINLYRNAAVPGGLVAVPKEQFHRVPVLQARLASLRESDVKPLPGAPRVGGARQVEGFGAGHAPTRDLAPQKNSTELWRERAAASAGDGSSEGAATRFDRTKAATTSASPELRDESERSAPPTAVEQRAPDIERQRQPAAAPPATGVRDKSVEPGEALRRMRTQGRSVDAAPLARRRTAERLAPPPSALPRASEQSGADALGRLRARGASGVPAPKRGARQIGPGQSNWPSADTSRASAPLRNARPRMPDIRSFSRGGESSARTGPRSGPKPMAMPRFSGGTGAGGLRGFTR
ncbi:MAG: DUF6600 domain-containing protein [Candidatus Binatia bacterium]